MTPLLIGIGGSLGAAARFILGKLIKKIAHNTAPFPLATLLINITGSFILGVLANHYLAGTIEAPLWNFAGAGFCGAFTTFSTFGHEAITLFFVKKNLAILYVFASLTISVLAAGLGFVL